MTYSIIIPCYDATEQDFRRCLESIKNQTKEALEVICVDDCSLVDTPKMALEYGYKYIRHKKNMQNGGARNTGIRASKGDYLIFVNSDDYIMPETIEEIDKVNKGQDLIIIGFETFGTHHFWFIPDETNTPYLSKLEWYGEPMHVVNRNFIIENEIFEETGVICADIKFTLEIEKKIKSYTYVSQALYKYQVGHESSLLTKIGKGLI